MCIYYRFICVNCSRVQDRVLPCQPTHQRQKCCEVIQQVALTPQILQGDTPICQVCGVSQQRFQPRAETASRRDGRDGQAQQPFRVRREIDLEETVKKYNEERSQVFAHAEAEMSKKEAGEANNGAEENEAKDEDTAFEKAWRQLKADIDKA